MARMGQCFSTSMDALGIDVNEGTSWSMEEDIETPDGSYCFSDGVGRISSSLAQQVGGITADYLAPREAQDTSSECAARERTSCFALGLL